MAFAVFVFVWSGRLITFKKAKRPESPRAGGDGLAGAVSAEWRRFFFSSASLRLLCPLLLGDGPDHIIIGPLAG